MERKPFLPTGYSTPQGMPSMYYFACPEDSERFREEICQDLWAVRPCAVYPGDLSDAERLRFELEQANLAVFPVTTRFLEDEGCLEALRLALALHVPILPLQKEPRETGIAERFNRLCEDWGYGLYQMLWKEDPDPTVLPYPTKLTQLLDAVLPTPQQAAQLRSAFLDGHIFLSYRKKNRALALKLMKAIHDLPGRDNLCFWYDEFLLPDEPWDKEIESQLVGDDCRVMALAVTPDIVNEPNFVLGTEYPMAQKAGLPILPVMMAPTSPEELRSHGLDVHIDINSAEAAIELDRKLKSPFGKAKEGRNDQDRYRLGMAYLNGIHVEVDRQRGLALLQQAADHGYLDAVRALADMYSNGIGVELDYDKAIRYRKKVTANLEKTRDKNPWLYFHTMTFLGLDCYSAGQLEQARQCFEACLELYREYQKKHGAPTVICLSACFVYSYLAYVLIQKPEPEFPKAEDCLLTAKKMAERLLEDAEEKYRAQTRSGLLSIYEKLTFLYRRWAVFAPQEERKRLLEQSAEYLGLAGELSRKSPSGPSPSVQMEGAKALARSGKPEQAVSLAKEAVQRSREIFDGASSSIPGLRQSAQLELILCCANAASILLEAGDPGGAEEYIRQAEALNQPLCDAGQTQALKYAGLLSLLRARLSESL